VIVRETSVVEFFIDGAKVGEIATVANIPTVDLAEVLHMESIESAANNFQVDYLATAGGRA
jgi:spore maturation protein SpmB